MWPIDPGYVMEVETAERTEVMKNALYLSTVVMLMISATLLSAQEIDQGFLGIPWKSTVYELKDLIQVGENGPVTYYTNPNEIHKLYGEEVPGVIYGFYKSALFAVFIKIDSLEMFSNLKEHLTSKYGVPDKSYTARSEQTIYKWKSNDIKIKLKISEIERTMKLAYYYTPLSTKVNEDDLEAAQRKSPRLFPIQKGKVPAVVPLLEY
jgi:hypothetical protein